MKIYLEPFSKGEISFNVRGDVSVDELVAYVKEKLEGVMYFKEASYEENGELVFEFESSVNDVIYNVTIVDKRVTIIAENIKEENDPEIIHKAQEIVNSFKRKTFAKQLYVEMVKPNYSLQRGQLIQVLTEEYEPVTKKMIIDKNCLRIINKS